MITEQFYKRTVQGLKMPKQGGVSAELVRPITKTKTFSTLKIYEHFLKKGFMVNEAGSELILKGENAIITINKGVV